MMNSILHGVTSPHITYQDTLGKHYLHNEEFDIILANPPFKGSILKANIHPDFKVDTTKTELLFLELMYDKLFVGGRCAVIVPDGVLFGSSNAHQKIREMLIENTELKAVISLPSGVFKPYAGVSTAILIFTKGDETKKVWFYDLQVDGFSLDDKRTQITENDIPDLKEKYKSIV
jgi:type I restriction enzyme M protein